MTSKTRILHLFLLPSLAGFATLAFATVASQAQEMQAVQVQTDSLADDEWSDETLYEIALLRFERWAVDHTSSLTDPALLNEVARLKKEAAGFAANGDFEMARIWLDMIWGLLEPAAQTDGEAPQTLSTNGFSEKDPPELDPSAKRWTWEREIVSGVDFWRQRFNFGFFDQDSTLREGDGNPSTGLRINLDYGSDLRDSFHGYTFLKYSRDYLSGEASLRVSRPVATRSFFQLENRFEGTSFIRTDSLKYWQNGTTATLALREFGTFVFEAQDDFLLRHHYKASTFYADYYENTAKAEVGLNLSPGSVFSVAFRNHFRLHPDDELKDYRENRMDVNWSQAVGEVFNFALENQVRFRDYTKAPRDTVLQDYWEDYFHGEVELVLFTGFGVEVQGDVIKRDYKLFTQNSLPDYWDWQVVPEVYTKFGSGWRLGLGFSYGKVTHQRLVNRLPVAAFDVISNIPFEDYFEYGPVVTLELFQLNGLLLNAQHSFLIRRYPNTPTRNVDDFNLYTDRNINSFLLFLTWTVSRDVRFNVLANFDDENIRKNSNGDSQNTIVGLEVSYSF